MNILKIKEIESKKPKKMVKSTQKRKKLEKSNHKLYNFNSLIRYER